MMSEFLIVLAFLCFLAVRGDYVRHLWALILAVFLWGGSRVFLLFCGDIPPVRQGAAAIVFSVLAVCGLTLCVFFIFLACLGARTRPKARKSPAAALETEGDSTIRRRMSPTERLRQLIPGEGKTRL